VRLWAEWEIRKNLVVIKSFFEIAVEFFPETETIMAFTFIEQYYVSFLSVQAIDSNRIKSRKIARLSQAALEDFSGM
jgi:hypothetical protein